MINYEHFGDRRRSEVMNAGDAYQIIGSRTMIGWESQQFTFHARSGEEVILVTFRNWERRVWCLFYELLA